MIKIVNYTITLLLLSIILTNGLYFLHRNISHSLDTEIMEPNHKRVKLSKDETYLWHLRLGHINLNKIKRLVSDGPLSDLKVDDLPTCESCLEGKMTKGRSLPKVPEPLNV